jgi:hypothetical protein
MTYHAWGPELVSFDRLLLETNATVPWIKYLASQKIDMQDNESKAYKHLSDMLWPQLQA